jgi:hypothetical protein
MKAFKKRIVEGNNFLPSDVCLKAFSQNFENAINVEWSTRENFFEAVFYKDSLEHIALFSSSGSLMEYSVNLPSKYLPESIKSNVEKKGEIMNTVLRNKGNQIEYEVIFRDKSLNRHLVILSDVGKIMEETGL